ncbi:response regulator [Magnetococcus sp. PR-3]|uniref:response regulator n=1 Tax=Magnetococcus sp. PR-3 TaxID=3120355 RepID=UPI002FCDFA31
MFTLPRPLKRSIGLRIFLGFGLVLTLIVAQAMVGNVGIDRAVVNFKQYGQTNSHVREVLDLERNVLDLQRGVLAYTYSGYDGLALRVKEMQKILSRQMQETRSRVKDPERAKLLSQMDNHFRLYAENFDAAVEERQLRDRMAFEELESSGDQALKKLEVVRTHLLNMNDNYGAALASHAQTLLALVQRDALRFLIKPNSRLVDATSNRLKQLSNSLDELTEHRGQRGSLAESHTLKSLAGSFQKAFNNMVQASRAYMHLVYVVMGGEAARIGYLADQLKKISLEKQGTVETKMAQSVSTTQWVTRGVSVVGILLGLFLAWRITNNISKPIQAMTRTLTGLARGKQDDEIPGRGRSDEIGAMAMAANVFKEKAHELENASRYKSEFLANMSHELRTPLNSLLILAKMLSTNEEKNLSKDQVESAQVIHDSGRDLLNLINDILDLSKVEAGRMDLYVEKRPYTDLQHTITRLFQPLATEKDLSFIFKIAPGVPTALSTDWAKVEQILRNFLSNAFKFTSQGSITVHLARPSRGRLFMNPELDTENCMVMAVTDTGIGIPQDKREQIFEAFRQADGTTSRAYGGTGLGLSISRKFADLLGGEIQVESTEGHGSTFMLYLPLELPHQLQKTTTLHYDDPTDLLSPSEQVEAITHFKSNNTTVLVVDDDRRNVFALKRMLDERVGLVLSAANGQQALAVLNEHPDIDLVLMDIMMPEMDGYAATEEIRKQPRFQHLPVVALTAKAMPGDREKCLSHGASDYLAKPVETMDLLAVLIKWLEKPKEAIDPQIMPDGSGTILPKVRILEETESPETDHVELESLSLGLPPIIVLIVDDDMRNTFSLAQVLQKRADKILMARDGEKAIEELERNPQINCILMDIMMPNMDGYEAMQRIRQDKRFVHLPIIALTAKTQEADRKKCMEAGASDFLSKPVALEDLLNTMRTHILKDQAQ